METKAAILGRRSVRRYTDQPLQDADVQDIITAGLYAPSALDFQPWYFVVVKSSEQLEKLREFMSAVYHKFEPVLYERFRNHPAAIAETKVFLKSLGGTQCCILAFMLRQDYPDKKGVIEGVSAAVQNMLLAAYDQGIGSCWMTAPMRVGMEEELRLKYAPEHGDFVAAITFGYPAYAPKTPKRKEGRYEII
ncbi:MAG: nitroreductase family protein [Syntrophomonadaceae bacterium]|nr:nitroreductase family protein [Syntrophomonadaceae bacterium]